MNNKVLSLNIGTTLIIFWIIFEYYMDSNYKKRIKKHLKNVIAMRSKEKFSDYYSMDKNNIIIITTTLPNNVKSEKRKNNLINNFNKYEISIIFNQGKQEPNKIFFEIMKNRFEVFIKSDYEYGILCDDDFFPINNFMNELNKTVELLPKDWECLHLCPGYLWGRRFKDKNKIGELNPEHNMENIPFHHSGRYYLNCDSKKYFSKKFWLGGPIAVLVNKKTAINLLNRYISMFNSKPINNDVLLTKMLNDKSFVCRDPQLGYENEEGGSTFIQDIN